MVRFVMRDTFRGAAAAIFAPFGQYGAGCGPIRMDMRENGPDPGMSTPPVRPCPGKVSHVAQHFCAFIRPLAAHLWKSPPTLCALNQFGAAWRRKASIAAQGEK
jgi:hypothetical protein